MSTRRALLIASGSYEDPTLAALTAPNADVTALETLLRDPEVGAFDEVVTLRDSPEREIRRAVSRFFMNRGREDFLALYFSGHGVLDRDGQLYLAAGDTSKDMLRASAIPAAFIRDEMDSSRSLRQVLILDCCQSGAFGRGAKGTDVNAGDKFRGDGSARVILTATDAVQFAWEGDQVLGANTDRSLFTHFIVEGLSTGEADENGDGHITDDELFAYVSRKVRESSRAQSPQRWAFAQTDQLILAKNRAPRATPAQIPARVQELAESNDVHDRTSAALALRDMLEAGHRGRSLAAQALLRRLTSDDSRKVSSIAEEALARLVSAPTARPRPGSSPAPPAAPPRPPSPSQAPAPRFSIPPPVARLISPSQPAPMPDSEWEELLEDILQPVPEQPMTKPPPVVQPRPPDTPPLPVRRERREPLPVRLPQLPAPPASISPPPRRDTRKVAAMAAVLAGVAVVVAVSMVATPTVGKLEIKTVPKDATILIDYLKVSEGSPFNGERPLGFHTVSVLRPGYARQDVTVDVKRGPANVVSVELRPTSDTGFKLTSVPPDQAVWLDGAPLMGPVGQARTDFRASRIAPGRHVLEIKGEEAWLPWRREVEIEPGHIQEVMAILRPAHSPPPIPMPKLEAPVAPRKARPQPLPVAAVSRPITAEPVPAGPRRPAPSLLDDLLEGAVAVKKSCEVAIATRPWSEVWIDGKNTGRHTPYSEQIPCGKHNLRFVRDDLQLARDEVVTVRPGEKFKQSYLLLGPDE